MSLFVNILFSKVPEQVSGRKEVIFLIGIGSFELEIVGDARYQAALEAICGAGVSHGVDRFETAMLMLEDHNPHDKNAVRVEIRRNVVGYLSQEAASRYRQQLEARGTLKATAQCRAVIRGGWVSSDGRKGPYRVWLDLPTSYQ